MPMTIAASGGSLSGLAAHDVAPGVTAKVVRGANFVVAHLEAVEGAEVADEVPDEHLVVVPRASVLEVATADESFSVAGPALVAVPPGATRLRATAAGSFVRICTSRAVDLLALAANGASYASRPEGVAPPVAWPDPAGGFRLRGYRLDDYAEEPGVLGRIFRCTTLMVNVFNPWTEPRDPTRMTPHAHDDFEQCSLTLAGDFVHHLRYPWGPDLSAWREDEHLRVESPSAVVIPRTVIHTSQNVGAFTAWEIVDVFCPPRLDFSLQEGYVRNAGDYPMPA